MAFHLDDILKPGMKGAFYGRHSTEKQTMDTQKFMAYELAKDYGCSIIKDYLDAGVSARKIKLDDRPGGSELLKDARNNKFDFVIISDNDRIARDPIEHQVIRALMGELKIPIVLSSSRSLYDSGDFLVDLIKDGVSKLEVDNTLTRTRDTAKSLAKHGKWVGGKAPFGYHYDAKTKKIIAYDDELLVVDKIYKLYRNKEGFQAIATIISREFKKTFSKSFVRWIITNPFYSGHIALYRKKAKSGNSLAPFEDWLLIKNDNIPAIMTLEEWKETWMIFEGRKNGTISPKMYKTSFLLSNLITCSKCQSLLSTDDQTTNDKKRNKPYGKKYYCCKSKGCNYKIEASKLHRTVDVIISDLKSRNISELAEGILSELQKEKLSLVSLIHESEETCTKLQHKIHQLTTKIKELLNVKDVVDSKSNETNLARILQIKRQDVESEIKRTKIQTENLRKRIQIFEKIGLNQNVIIQNLTQLSQSIVGQDDNQLRKMLLFLIENATIHVQAKDEKGIILKGSVSFNTRHNLFQPITTF